MALPVDLLLSRTELPQDGARLNPAHPLAGRFVTAYLPGVSSDNLAFGGPGGIVGNAHSRSAIPAGPTLRLSGAGANATTNRSYGPTPSYPLTMVIVCRQSNNTTSTIAALAAASAISGSYFYVGGGSSTILTFGARNAFGTALSLNVTVPADANGNQAIGQDMVIVLQSLSASDHRICVNGSAIATATTNIGSMSAWDRLFFGQTSGTTGLDVAAVLFAHGGVGLTDAQMRQIASHPREVWELFEPQRLTIPGTSDASGVSLTVSDSTHAHTAENLTLTTTGSTSLAVSDAAHAHAADSPTLTTSTALAVSDALHAHAAESLVLGVTGATNLVVADASHAHNVDGLILTAQSLLAIQDALHAHAADNLTINTAPSLLIANALHAHTSDGLALTVSAWLVVANAAHGHFADVVVFTGAAPDSWIAGDGTMSAPRIGVARNGELWALIVDDDNVPTHAKRLGTTKPIKVRALPGGNMGQVMTDTGVVLVVL